MADPGKIVWLTAKDVQAACPQVGLRRVRFLLVGSDLAHRNGKRIYLRADRLEQFIDEAFAIPSPGRARGRSTRPASASTASKARPTGESVFEKAAALATGAWKRGR